jgi:hypothetical protein
MNAPMLRTGQQAVTNAAVALPSLIGSAGETLAEGLQITLRNLKASTASLFYGPAGVTTATGNELAPGEAITFILNDLALIFVIAAASSTATASWTVTTAPV